MEERRLSWGNVPSASMLSEVNAGTILENIKHGSVMFYNSLTGEFRAFRNKPSPR